LFNLLSNALRFSPPKGVITLNSKREGNLWTVEVWDEGSGVPPERLGELFQRFSQINNPLLSSRTGSGLGLAICKSILELHHGTMTARNRLDGEGFVVSFSMPTNRDET
jgi:signal transduction histidine kinase